MVRSGRTPVSGLNVRPDPGAQGQLHQRGLSRRSTPNSVRITMRRLSVCRRGFPQAGHPTWTDSAVLSPDARPPCPVPRRADPLLPAVCRTTVSAASALVRVNTSRTTVWVSVTGGTTVPMSTLTAGVPGDVGLSGRAGSGELPGRGHRLLLGLPADEVGAKLAVQQVHQGSPSSGAARVATGTPRPPRPGRQWWRGRGVDRRSAMPPPVRSPFGRGAGRPGCGPAPGSRTARPTIADWCRAPASTGRRRVPPAATRREFPTPRTPRPSTARSP